MHAGTVSRGIVDQKSRRKILKQRFGAADVERISVSEEQPVETIDAGNVQIFPQHAAVVAFASAVEQPVGAWRAQMNCTARSEIEHSDFAMHVSSKLRRRDVIMIARKLGEPMNNRENGSRKEPIEIVKSYRERAHHRRARDREQRSRENEKSDRNDYKICDQRNRRDEMEIPKHQQQRAEPRCERDRTTVAKRFESGIENATGPA